jgi:class 3 adenylate cyclase/tetratricopeptide (TPR) repeat protein
MSVVCPSCGAETPEGFPRCAHCGELLTPNALGAREERKIVTCLFCDLVGFTARAERMDPEDVRRLLQPYHASVRAELERFGGTVEKFIGDAVMAIFGAPIAHEDDPERAVRAALAIRETLAADGQLEVRIGITTGEALVALDGRPEAGEGMVSGDVVNTAARLQAAAHPGGLLVDESTMRATERAIDYAEASTINAKGKSLPIAVWQAARARARVGVERLSDTPLVGRERELTLLRSTWSRVAEEREPQLMTLVGVPGIGKSRLVSELFDTIRAGAHGLVSWRNGRSLPYGEGVTFWALSEIVKAQAGILESDPLDATAAKLRQAVESVLSEPAEAAWVERHLRPLAGLDTQETGGSGDASEAFAAWRRFLEAIALERRLVLVFEDLHWADDAMLDFVDYLVDRSRSVPLLALCTARPELLTRRPGWGGGKVNSSTILLSPLSEDETSSLVSALLGKAAIDPDVWESLLERAGGNPLYAEEFARMLVERPTETVVPETVQGMIAARIDTLSPEEKALLQKAAIVGRVFWLGALGRERWTIEERLHSLERKEFVRRELRSSVSGEDEYVFRHALVRDVAYEQIPRSDRAEMHRGAAEWIESLGRPDDHAETLAHHYAAALEFARVSGQDVGDLLDHAQSTAREAGDRASVLNAYARAARFYERALDLLPADDPRRGRLLLVLGRSLWLAEARGEDELLAAIEALLATNDREGAAEAETLLVDGYWGRGQRESAATHLARASTLVDELEPSPTKASSLCTLARSASRASDHAGAARIAREALGLAESLELDEVRASALLSLGAAKLELGEGDAGFANLEESIELSLAIGSPEAIRGNTSLAHQLRHHGRFAESLTPFEEALRLSEAFGVTPQRRMLAGMLPQMRYRRGRWDEALEAANAYLEEVGGSHYHAWHALQTRGVLRLSRGDDSGIDDSAASIDAARASVDLSVLTSALGIYGRSLLLVGRLDDAREALEESLAIFDSLQGRSGFDLPYLTVTAFEVGVDGDRVLGPRRDRVWAEAATSYFAGEFAQAADRYAEIGSLTDEAEARLRAARHLIENKRQEEGAEQLELALRFYRGVEATRFVREGEALLAAAS